MQDYQSLQNDFRRRLAEFSRDVEAACAQGLTDLPKLSENLVAVFLMEFMEFRNLKNVNTERRNFPAIDLADDKLKVGVQVTATGSLEKIKSTLATAIRHGLHEKYSRIVVYVLTKKQDSYSDAAINEVTAGRISFDVRRDILDFQDLLAIAVNASPIAVRRALDALDAYQRGALEAFEEGEFDPPTVFEPVELNLIELYLPKTLYIADVIGSAPAGWQRNPRSHLRTLAQKDNRDRKLPSGYEVYEQQLVTFHNLEEGSNAFAGLYDRGTATPLSPDEFSGADMGRERLIKSLLRFTLQEQLYRHRVRWQHDAGVFFFLPESDGQLLREITWKDKKTASRTVVKYTPSKKDPSKGGYKHLAFAVDFLFVEGAWYMAIRPDWYFSTNPDYRVSPISDALLKYIKREEANQSVEQHFRFLCRWLRVLDADDLFAFQHANEVHLSFGDPVTFTTHPCLDDARWLPSRKQAMPSLEDALDSGELFAL